jgi:hypothetical protein
MFVSRSGRSAGAAAGMLGSMLLWRLVAGIEPGNKFAGVMGMAGRSAGFGGGGCNCERASGAARVDRESGHHHARG